MQETRQAIMNILKERGQVTIEELRDELKLTPATVLHHLNVLRGEGLVDLSGLKRHQTPGRPQHVYALTERASDYFPKNYVEFADLTLREIGDRAGLDELDSIMRGVARRMMADVPQPAPGEPMPQRLDRAVNFLNQKGYIARWESSDKGYLLHMTNCPFQALAHRRSEPCVMDVALMIELLGVTPQRIAWMASGDNTCTYLVPEPDDQQPTG